MDFKKPSEKTAKNTIAMTGGIIAGGMASKGVVGMLHTATTSTDAAEIKKDQNTQLLKQGALAVAAGVAAACVTGTDTIATLTQGSLVGVAAVQALEVIKTIYSRSSDTVPTTAAQKFAARAMGLGCPCDHAPALNGRGLRYPGLIPTYDMSEMDTFAPASQPQSGGLDEWASQPLLSA